MWHPQCGNGGTLGIRTKLVIAPEAFSRWHYKNDATHICFYSRETLGWIGQTWQTQPRFVGNDVILFEKPLCGLDK